MTWTWPRSHVLTYVLCSLGATPSQHPGVAPRLRTMRVASSPVSPIVFNDREDWGRGYYEGVAKHVVRRDDC